VEPGLTHAALADLAVRPLPVLPPNTT